jgi:hypothetical protein
MADGSEGPEELSQFYRGEAKADFTKD